MLNVWIDSFIGFFSPKRGFRRAQFRQAHVEIQKRSYEGASRGRRTANWRTRSTSQNAESESQIELLRNRTRDLVRNNPYANRSISLIANNTVGKGIMLNLANPDDKKQLSQTTLWRNWALKKDIDFEGKMNINAMQNLIMRSVAESGEVLIRRRRVTRSNGTIGIKLQVLESDFLATNVISRNTDNGNRVIQGIEVNDEGKVVAYHLYKNHPGNVGIDLVNVRDALIIQRISAEDIIHVFLTERPGQLRGVPWLAPVIIRMRDLDEFEDAMLVRQKVAACFSAFIFDQETPDALNNDEKSDFDLEKLEPGTVEHLPPGKDIKFGTPPLPQGEAYKFFIQTGLHGIAAGIGVSYEGLTSDLSEVNFSSARMGWLEFGRNIDSWRSNMLIPQFNDQVADWFFEAITLLGENVDETVISWTAPRREMIDPTKEVPAKIRAVRAGISTLSDTIRENGKEPDKHLAEIAADNAELDRLNLVLDTDPRKVTIAGMFQVEETEQTPPGNSIPIKRIKGQ